MPVERTVVFETERLAVRLATVEDADMYEALWNDPRVMTYVGFPYGLRMGRDQIVDRLRAQEGPPFGRLLVVELKGTGEAVGEGHMSDPGRDGVVEPDVKLLPAFWGHRYGREAWQGLVDYAFTHTDCQAISGSPNVDNAASIKMQEATGAVRVDEGVYEFPESMRAFTAPVHAYVYRLERADWERRRPNEEA